MKNIIFIGGVHGVGKLSAPIKHKTDSALRNTIEQKLKTVFDPRGIFQ